MSQKQVNLCVDPDLMHYANLVMKLCPKIEHTKNKATRRKLN